MPLKILRLLWLAATFSVAQAAPIGITVTPTRGLVTTESGSTATFTVVLNSQPTADVTIALASSDISEGTVGPAALTFTPGNWNTPQIVTVIGVDDLLVDGNVAYKILTTAAQSADRGYNNLNPADVAATNTDNDNAGTTTPAQAGTTTPAQGRIRISIKNVYDVRLNFGVLGNGKRDGTDRVEGALNRQGSGYVGIVDASVVSNQTMAGMVGKCGPATYDDAQKLKVIGHPANGLNQRVQSVNPAAMTGQASNEYLRLEFKPETMTRQQPGPRRPADMLPDLLVSCHTLIDTLSGIAFLPLNDSRWTMDGGGYVIRLPLSGVLDYTDTAVPAGTGMTAGPFDTKKSIWTIQVERLP